MGKLMFAGILLLCASFTKGERRVPTITIDPNPPVAGKKATITYDGPKNTVLTLEWDPEAQPNSVTIGSNGRATIVVPANATSLIISDGTTSIGVTVSP